MRKSKNLTDDIRMEIIQEYLGGASKYSLARKNNLYSSRCITEWMRKFGIEDPQKNQIPIGLMVKEKIDESQDVSELKKEIHQLKASLVHSKMKNEALERMIDLAEKEFQIPIRKKSGAKQ